MKDVAKEITSEVKEQILELKSRDPCVWFDFAFTILNGKVARCEVTGNKGVVEVEMSFDDGISSERKEASTIVITALIAGLVEELSGHKVLIESPVGRFGNPRPTLMVRARPDDDYKRITFHVEVLNNNGEALRG